MENYRKELEQKILSAIFQDVNNYEKVCGYDIGTDDFTNEDYRALFERVGKLQTQCLEISPTSMKCDEKLFLELYKSSFSVDVKSVCTSLKMIINKNRVLEACNNFIANDTLFDNEAMIELQNAMEIPSYEVKKEFKEGAFLVDEGLTMIEKRLKGYRGLLTGIKSLDELTGGFYDGTLNIIAARPGIGKTALGVNLLSNMDKNSKVLFFALEMSSEEVNRRLVSIRSGVKGYFLKNPKQQYFEKYVNAYQSSELKNSIIIDKPRINIQYIRTVCRNLKKQGRLNCIIIDQLSKIDISNLRLRKLEAYSFITNELKLLSRELEVPVFLLCQINREGNDTPRKEHLKDSGSIEEDADTVMLLHRNFRKQADEVKNESAIEIEDSADDVIEDNKLKIILDKNRDGEVGTVEVKYILEKQYIGD